MKLPDILRDLASAIPLRSRRDACPLNDAADEIESLRIRLAKWEKLKPGGSDLLDPDPMIAIAASRDWTPLQPGDDMTITYQDRQYLVTCCIPHRDTNRKRIRPPREF